MPGRHREGRDGDQREGGHDASDRALQERLPAARRLPLRGPLRGQDARQQQPAATARHAAHTQSPDGQGHRVRRQDQEARRHFRYFQQQQGTRLIFPFSHTPIILSFRITRSHTFFLFLRGCLN